LLKIQEAIDVNEGDVEKEPCVERGRREEKKEGGGAQK
jgi:hypothetical protein